MLKIEHLTKKYPGNEKGVHDLSLHVYPKDLYAFIGQNGAGKTTTLKAICQIHDFEKGNIWIDGVNLKENPLLCKQKIAYIPDNPDLFEYLTGNQYLHFIADLFELSAKQRNEKIAEYAQTFALTPALSDLISSYSHGMKQKLAILSALIHDPKLLLLDEPFVGLDPKATAILKEILRTFCKNGGAVFFSTHVLDVAEKLCNKVAILKDGRLLKSGLMSEIVPVGTSLESLFLEVSEDA